MRVLQVNLNNEGGAFSLVCEIQKRIKKDSVIFDYYTMGEFAHNNIYEELIFEGSKVYEAKLRKNRFVGHILLPWKFFKFLRNNNYEVIHIHSDSAWKMLLYALPAKLAKIRKIILHSHSTGINGDNKNLKTVCHNIAKKKLIKCGTLFVACSHEAGEWLFDSKKVNIKIIKNGIDLERFRFNNELRNTTRDKLNYKEEDIVIGTVGDFSITKNPELLVDIFNKIYINDKNYKLIFVGKGEREQLVKEYAKSKTCNESILFYGISNQVEKLLNAMDCFILPSLFEGLPMSAVEAQTSGLPTILSKNITRDASIEGYCWYCNDYKNLNEWTSLIKNNTFKTNRLKAATQARLNNFDINITVKEFLNIYKL